MDHPKAIQDRNFDSEFFPKGAILFFLLLIVFFALVWLGIYALMIYRHKGL
ncbi:MAG: hypothetical protein P4M08_04575 [Oligoflexia bacterium]|nr:hypothetical protein [Oligoflexia bacterium]